MAPVGMIISALIAGTIADASSWRFMFVITGGVSFIYFLAIIWKLPFKVPKRNTPIDFLGILILGSGLVMLLLSLTSLSDKIMPDWLAYILIVVSICLISFFLYYNMKLAKCPLFPPELFNRSTVLCELTIFFNNVVSYCERFYIPYIQIRLHGISPTKSGMIMAIVGCGSIALSPVANIAYKRVCTKFTVLIVALLYSALLLLNAFHVGWFFNIWLYTIINFICIGIYLILTVNVTNYNYGSVPMKYANSLGVLN